MRFTTKVSILASTLALIACAEVKNDTNQDDIDSGSTGGSVALGGASTGGKTGSTGGVIGAGATTSSGGGSATGGSTTGGASTGGSTTGGASTGGSATGGASTGGSSGGGNCSGSCTAWSTFSYSTGTYPSIGQCITAADAKKYIYTSGTTTQLECGPPGAERPGWCTDANSVFTACD